MSVEVTAGDPVALLLPDLATELAVTRALLARVPWEKADWKPHAKSMSLGGLAGHVALMPGFMTAMAALDVLEFSPAAFAPPVMNSADDLVAYFDAECTKLHASLAGMDWPRMQGNWKMMAGGRAFIDNSRGFLLRHMGINHLVHHRAQLGVYLRLLDVPIPGSYGPSADA